MNIEAWIKIEERDLHGQLKSFQKFKANSFVRGFIDILQTQMSQVAILSGWKDTGNTSRDTASNSANFAINGGAGVTTFGVMVGTGSTAVAIGDYALGTAIAHGSGSGQLMYGACTTGIPATNGSSREFTVARTFTNSSGGAVTVNELGIYAKALTYYVMIDRTLNTFTVNNGSSKTVTYTIKVTV